MGGIFRLRSTTNAPSLTGKEPTRVRWLIFALASLTSWFLYFHRYAWGVVKKDIQDEFGFTKTQMGWLDSCFSVTYATGQIPGGLLGDIFGPALILTIILVGWSMCLGLMYFGSGFLSFAGIRLAFGATQAGAYPNLGKVSKSWFPSSIRTTMQGFVASFSGRFGAASALFLVPVVLMGAMDLSWRQTLVVLAVGGVAFAVVLRLFMRSEPKDHPWTNEEEQELLRDEGESTKDNVRTRFARNRWAWISFAGLLLHIFTSAFADQIYANWIPMFLEEDKGLGKAQMGIFASLPLIGGAIGGLFGGALNDILRRFIGLRWARRLVGITGKIIAGGLVVYSLSFADGRMMMVVIAFAKFFTDWSQPTVWGAVTDIAGRDTGRVFGMVNMMGSMAGFVAGPTLGKIIQDSGWRAMFFTIAGVYFVSGAVWLLINTEKKLIEEIEPGKPTSDAGTA